MNSAIATTTRAFEALWALPAVIAAEAHVERIGRALAAFGEAALHTPLTLAVDVSPDTRWAQWTFTGAGAPLLGTLAAQASAWGIPVNVPPEAPSAARVWLEASSVALDLGYQALVDQPVARLRGVGGGVFLERLSVWATSVGATAIALGDSQGRGNTFSRVSVALPGGDVTAQLERGLGALAALGVTAPSHAVIAPLIFFGASGLTLEVDLTALGLSRVALCARGASTGLRIAMQEALGARDDERLAAIEAILGADGPSRIAWALTADGPRLEVGYDARQGEDTRR